MSEDYIAKFTEFCKAHFNKQMPAPFDAGGHVILQGSDGNTLYLSRAVDDVGNFVHTVFLMPTSCPGEQPKRYTDDPEELSIEPLFCPTEELLGMLDGALPYPVENVWGVVDESGTHVVEFIFFTVSPARHVNELSPELYWAVRRDRIDNNVGVVLVPKEHGVNLAEFWALVETGAIVPVRELLRSTNFVLGATPDNCGAYGINDELLMHPVAWRRWPHGEVRLLGNVVNVNYFVNGEPGIYLKDN